MHRLEDVFWEEVWEEEFEKYESIRVRMKKRVVKRMGCQRMMLPVISKRDTDMCATSGLTSEIWWLKGD